MSATDNGRNSLAGLTLDAILGEQRTTPAGDANRSLLDIIRDDPHNYKDGHRDRKTWKVFREKLRLKRAGAAWTSSVHTPASDVLPTTNTRVTPRVSFRTNSPRSGKEMGHHEDYMETVPISDPSVPTARPLFSRRSSTRVSSARHSPHQLDDSSDDSDRSLRSQTNLNDTDESAIRDGSRRIGSGPVEERIMSAREAVAAQEAAEAAAAAAAVVEEEEDEEEQEEEDDEPEPVRMSLMDLLEETDRQMGFVGSRYNVDDEEDEDYDEEEEEEEEEIDEGIEHNCCVCMVRSKGAAFIPCGHTFCRLCSRELLVTRGNCPICNGFILEILDIF